MMTSRQINALRLCGVALLAMALAACGSSSGDSGSGSKGKKTQPTVVANAADSTKDMVAAVASGKAGPPVELKFELHARPQAGQLLEVDFAVLPSVPAIERIFAKFQGGEGFDLVDGGDLDAVDKPVPGTVIRHTVRVLPKRDGIYTLGATVSVDMPNDSLTRVYSIPVIVGEGLPDPTAKTEAADPKLADQTTPGTSAQTH